jgi:hypothetical protein
MLTFTGMLFVAKAEASEAESYLAHLREELALCKARTENAIIEQAGGDKGLGSNEEARRRAMTIALAESPLALRYRGLLAKVKDAERDALEARLILEEEAELQSARRYMIRAAEAEAARLSLN